MLGATSGAVYSQLASPRNHTAERSGGRAALLRERLTPLLDVEQRLTHHLSEIVHDRSMNSDHLSVGTEWQARTEQLKPSSSALRCDRDDLGDHSRSMVSADTLVDSEFDSPTAHDKAEKEELLSKVSSILRASAEYISELVGLPDVEVLRANRRLRIAEWAEYFLPEIERVSQRDYIPSDDDVLHARTQTKGIVEQVFRVSASNVTKYMNVVDIAGVGGMKQVWISRCENTDAVIFVAPIGAFDETLDDDSKTNRLAYSTQLFKQLFSNRLLNMATWVLFMNQVDVLQRKIAAGVRLNTWLEDFGDRPNDLDTAMGYFKDRFHMIKDDIVPWRAHFTHFTSAVDTKSMHPVLQTVPNVRDADSIYPEMMDWSTQGRYHWKVVSAACYGGLKDIDMVSIRQDHMSRWCTYVPPLCSQCASFASYMRKPRPLEPTCLGSEGFPSCLLKHVVIQSDHCINRRELNHQDPNTSSHGATSSATALPIKS